MRAHAITALAATVLAGALALSATATASPAAGGGGYSSGPSCAVKCIKSALIEPHTGAFAVRVRTDTPARIFVGVAKLIAPPGSWLGSTQSQPNVTSFSGHVSGLQPDTLYKITVSATDSQSRTERHTTFMRTRAVQTALPQGAGDVQSNVGCSQQCISSIKLGPEGTGTDVTVKTTVPAKLSVSVDRDAPGTISGTPFFGSPEDTVQSGDFTTYWNGQLDGLVPGSTYHIIIRAIDADGHIAYQHGLFRTKARRAKLVLSGIRVYYDGDAGANRGELSFASAINQKNEPRLRIAEKKVASGNWLTFPHGGRVDLMPLSRGLNIAVQARERDHAGGCFDDTGTGFWLPENGHTDSNCHKWTWLTVRKVVDLDAPVPGGDASAIMGGTGKHEFEILTSNSAPIRYVVHGYVQVKYS